MSGRSRAGLCGAALTMAILLFASPRELAAADDVAALLAEGDAHYARRGEGVRGGTAEPRETELAIQAYRRALAAAPGDLPALARLLRAINFRGAFCGADVETRKKIFEEGRRFLRKCVDTPPRPDYYVESVYYAELARARLAEER